MAKKQRIEPTYHTGCTTKTGKFALPLKQIAVTALIFWLTTAISFEHVSKDEVNFFQDHLYVRMAATFLLALNVLDFPDCSLLVRIVSAYVVVLIYYLLVEF